ncbi:mannosyl-oligosaccharide glucosidase [Biomphalaria pfeifferi]|uniref:Mannosyl-oligosaccharide glucosidase n=1 Tax=Biomphalaria pfeifferi TaxID=112525 RepID=A0AAD8EW71_BIOPF|nr:mannosyl-oligosaccharide glucosidase [Biomphalaria pfeifferi]
MTKSELRSRAKHKINNEETTAKSDKDDKLPPHWKLDLYAKLIGIGVLVLTVSAIAFFRYQQHLREIIITPLDSPEIIQDNSSLPGVNPDRFWGTYRPQAYFGIKSRSKYSPVFGLMWMTELTGQMPPPLRHWCDQGDRLEGYIWQMHDGKNFGIQQLQERTYTIKTEFLKRSGGDHGGDWSARIHFTPKNPQEQVVVSTFFYAALDEDYGKLEPILVKGKLNSVHGWHQDVGNFHLILTNAESSQQKSNYLVSHAKQLAQLKDVLMSNLKVDAWDSARTQAFFKLTGRRVPNDAPGPNFIVKQVTAQLPFTMEVIFQSGSVLDRPNELSGNVFSSLLEERTKEFNDKFETLFKLKEKGYPQEAVTFAQAVVSNMLGSIGYFYGSSLVQSVYNKEPLNYWEAPLYTGVPSRPFFPRGFLWDEGFHNLLISSWDEDISKDIIGHWMDLMNIEGWIPREQILGSEARAKVPSEFVVQRNTNANPPTFFLPLKYLIRNMIERGLPQDKDYLSALFPRLKTWFNYYNTTQIGRQPFTYRWHGRDPSNIKQLNPLTLTSGLDDYPRASHPTEDERHLDLRCWIAFAAQVMSDIAKVLGQDWQEYDATFRLLSDNRLLDQLHWSEKGKQYSDYGLHTEKIKLEKPKPPANIKNSQRQFDQDKIRVVLSPPSYQFVDAYGYVSLFPFLLKLIDPSSAKLETILQDITNPEKLWTNYGLRSLSRRSKFYDRFNTEHDPPYWRGTIWININYMCLSALHHYRSVEGRFKELAGTVYSNLRNNLVNNIIKEYQRTGYIWENYSDKTGEGKGSHPFTGWSALVVLMMAEKY